MHKCSGLLLESSYITRGRINFTIILSIVSEIPSTQRNNKIARRYSPTDTSWTANVSFSGPNYSEQLVHRKSIMENRGSSTVPEPPGSVFQGLKSIPAEKGKCPICMERINLRNCSSPTQSSPFFSCDKV